MVLNFLKIRLKQFGRELDSLGLPYILFYFVLLLAGMFVFYKKMNVYPDCYLAISIPAAIVGYIHLTRKDKRFISTTVNPPLLIYFSEYTFFALPLIILTLFTQNYFLAFLFPVLFLLISLINFSPSKIASRNLSALIPPDNFEWRTGLRRNFYPALIIYALAIGLAFFKFASLIFLWMIVGIIASFYAEGEPLNVLHSQEMPAKKFLHKKIKDHLLLYFKFTFPILLVYAVFNFDTLWIAALIYIFTLTLPVLFIVTKYGVYVPNEKLTANSMVNSLSIISVFFPFLIPLPLIFCIKYYRRSLKNLSHFLHAYH